MHLERSNCACAKVVPVWVWTGLLRPLVAAAPLLQNDL